RPHAEGRLFLQRLLLEAGLVVHGQPLLGGAVATLAADAVNKLKAVTDAVVGDAVVRGVALQAQGLLGRGLGVLAVQVAGDAFGAFVVEHLEGAGVLVVSGPGVVFAPLGALGPVLMVAGRRRTAGHADPGRLAVGRGVPAVILRGGGGTCRRRRL